MAPYDSDQFFPTQVKLIQSDSVLRPVAQHFRLNVRQTPPDSPQLPSARAENAPWDCRDSK